jgi:hypothetical protein
MGFESTGLVAAGLGIGCNAGLGIVYQILEFYSSLHFINSDGSYNTQTVVKYVTDILLKYGLKTENTLQVLKNIIIYPSDYFAPKSYITGQLCLTENTHSIHHYDGSWLSKYMKKLLSEKIYITNKYKNRYIIFILCKLCTLKKIICEKYNL